MSWIDVYEPKIWQELLLPKLPKTRKNLQKLFETGQFTHRGILLHGKGGSGKSTFAKMLAETRDWDVIEIDPRGVGKKDLEDLEQRLTLKCFAEKYLVLANELSESSTDFRDGLRGVIDKHHTKAFFLFTDNHHQKLLDANPELLGRIKAIQWDDLDQEELKKYFYGILEKEGVDTRANRIIVDTQVKTLCPSIREMMSEIEFNI